MIRLVEIFRSIQGEGLFIGSPAVFVRTHGCNLQCPFCDTKYSWFTNLGEGYREVDDNQLWNEINDIRQKRDIVVFTGGEPMLWQDQLVNVIKRLPMVSHVETNGTVIPTPEMRKHVTHFVVSPKEWEDREMQEQVSWWIKNVKKMSLKFVISDEEDVTYINELFDLTRVKDVILQPERYAATSDTAWNNTAQSEYLKQLIKLIDWSNLHLTGVNWRVLPQLHYLLYGNKTGV